MIRKIALTIFAVSLAGSAMAASDGAGMSAADQARLKTQCKANKGSVGISEAQQEYCNWLARRRFFNNDGSMKSKADVTVLYTGMSAADQSSLKKQCKANKGSIGISEAQQEFCNWLARRR